MSDKASIIKEAQKYLARGQVDKAIIEWEKLSKEFPDGNTFNTIGDLYLKKNDKSHAVESFHKAARYFRNEGFSLKALALYKKILNLNPANTDALFALGELSEEKGISTDAIKYYLTCADILSKEGKKSAILKTYDKILNLSPSNIPLRTKVAELFLKEGLSVEAAKEYLSIARLHEDKEDFSNTEKYFKKTLEINPGNKEAMSGLSALAEKTGDSKKSADYLKDALEISPDDLELNLKYSEQMIAQGKQSSAISYLNKVLQAEPTNIKARKLMGELYLKEGDKQKAWGEYSRIIDEIIFSEKTEEAIEILNNFKDTEPVESRKKLIPLYKQKGSFDNAVKELAALGEIFLLSESSQPKDALKCYQEALQIQPDNAEIQEKIADIESELGEKPSAKTAAEKPIEESLAEADIFVRYGLYEEAKTLLEKLKILHPDNIEVHTKLKSLYIDTNDKELAVTECLILAEIHTRSGDTNLRDVIFKEAYDINPEDPRLVEHAPRHETDTFSKESFAGKGTTREMHQTLEDYSEEMAEAEFYSRQGLYDEARGICYRLQKIFPDNKIIKQKLASLDTAAMEAKEEETIKEPKKTIEAEKTESTFSEMSMEDIGINSIFESHEASEPKLENDVKDIFDEFKKGLEKELGAGDAETHYNLGIAYKEMGLTEDAIREFQMAKNDPKISVSATNMLGLCYMTKGLFDMAVEAFSSVIKNITTRDEGYWGVKYDLAESHEKNGNIKEASELYKDIYGWNSKFRNVSEKINSLQTAYTTNTSTKPIVEEKLKLREEKIKIKEEKEKLKEEKQKKKKERVSYL
ncbi:MAG: tetratricopeptide repeat protein [Nitrospiraceae bacterium]|nr:tetratricopeptide repeat protein [Nitrospiraceae bacterium]